MPDGNVHFAIWKTGWIVALPASAVVSWYSNPVGSGMLLGYSLGSILDGDLDIMGTNNAEGRMVKIPVLGWLLYGWSSVYGAAFREHHRSIWTHLPILSTIIRLIFFFFWVGIFYWTGWISYQPWQALFAFGVLVGLSFADFLHWAADMLSSEFKKTKRKSLTGKKNNGKIKPSKRKYKLEGCEYGEEQEIQP